MPLNFTIRPGNEHDSKKIVELYKKMKSAAERFFG